MSHYYFNAMLGSKILKWVCMATISRWKVAQKFCQKTVSAKSGRNSGRNLFLPGRFKPRFKPVLAETCQPWIIIIIIINYITTMGIQVSLIFSQTTRKFIAAATRCGDLWAELLIGVIELLFSPCLYLWFARAMWCVSLVAMTSRGFQWSRECWQLAASACCCLLAIPAIVLGAMANVDASPCVAASLTQTWVFSTWSSSRKVCYCDFITSVTVNIFSKPEFWVLTFDDAALTHGLWWYLNFYICLLLVSIEMCCVIFLICAANRNICVIIYLPQNTAAKFHCIKTLSGKVVVQSIAFRVVSIYWLGSSVPLISERKGTDPHLKHLRCTHFAS